MTDQQLIAFWHYPAVYPYCLWGKVKNFNPEGQVSIEGYSGMRFKPFLLLSPEDAEEVISKILALKEEHRVEQIAFEQKYNDKLNAIITIPVK